MGIDENIKLLTLLFLNQTPIINPYRNSLALWLKQSAFYYLISDKKNKVTLGLIKPKSALKYEIIIKIRQQMEKKSKIPWLIIADKLNPKYRSLFVRNNIPYVYKDISIFAPLLGLKLTTTSLTFNDGGDVEITAQRPSPFEFKLLAGYLTDLIKFKYFNLDDLQNFLKDNKYSCSKDKLSRVTRQLVIRNLIGFIGQGPQRKLHFESKEVIWEYLLNYDIKETGKTVKSNLSNIEPNNFIHTGETALAQFSDLASTRSISLAMTQKQFNSIKKDKKVGSQQSSKVYLEIRKEDPRLFSIKECLNPIELYFALKNHPNERIQIALSQMLRKYKLGVRLDE